jgi:hypothetical protein
MLYYTMNGEFGLLSVCDKKYRFEGIDHCLDLTKQSHVM